MSTSALSISNRMFMKKHAMLALCGIVAALGFIGAAGAVDFEALGTLGGPLGSALEQLSDMTPGIRALVGLIAFVVAFISLAALRNFGPVLFYIGVMIFGAVGLTVGGAILGFTI